MIQLGILGMSPNNAHPYSWSSIVNGVFDGEEISRRGYPGVTAYLTANSDTLGISQAKVTHVWTQDASISESIARSAAIHNVCANAVDMIGKVDAVVLARDDAQHHVDMARPFIEAGIPIFIDKPLATNESDLHWFRERVGEGKFIMSCSSMRYASECRTMRSELASLGKIELVTAVGKKDWLKYGVHMLEALFSTLGDPVPLSVQHVSAEGKDIVHLVMDNGVHATVYLFMDISLTFQLSLYGQQGWRLVDIRNYYGMFRDNLVAFINSVAAGRPCLDFSLTDNIISTLIGARRSMEQGGRIIHLK